MINQSILRKALIVSTALLLAVGGSKADVPFVGYHSVMVKTPPGVQSMHLYGMWGAPPEANHIITVTYNNLDSTPAWHYTAYMALNGTQLTINTYTSPDCTYGFTAQQVLTVPPDNGLRNFWIDLSPPRDPRYRGRP